VRAGLKTEACEVSMTAVPLQLPSFLSGKGRHHDQLSPTRDWQDTERFLPAPAKERGNVAGLRARLLGDGLAAARGRMNDEAQV